MWRYDQITGVLSRHGLRYATGYSGAGEGKNNPDMQHVRNVGPIPRGQYKIEAPCDTESHGPFVLALTPWEGNNLCGRSAFLIHGDSKSAPGTASKGCIIVPREAREKMWESGDRDLVVT